VDVEQPHGFQKVFHRLIRAAAAAREQKIQRPYPEGDKIQVYVHFAGQKGNPVVQGMVHACNRYSARQKCGPVLQKKEIPEDGRYTAQGCGSEMGIAQHVDESQGDRLFRY
jgi:hypothetical protein